MEEAEGCQPGAQGVGVQSGALPASVRSFSQEPCPPRWVSPAVWHAMCPASVPWSCSEQATSPRRRSCGITKMPSAPFIVQNRTFLQSGTIQALVCPWLQKCFLVRSILCRAFKKQALYHWLSGLPGCISFLVLFWFFLSSVMVCLGDWACVRTLWTGASSLSQTEGWWWGTGHK